MTKLAIIPASVDEARLRLQGTQAKYNAELACRRFRTEKRFLGAGPKRQKRPGPLVQGACAMPGNLRASCQDKIAGLELVAVPARGGVGAHKIAVERILSVPVAIEAKAAIRSAAFICASLFDEDAASEGGKLSDQGSLPGNAPAPCCASSVIPICADIRTMSTTKNANRELFFAHCSIGQKGEHYDWK